MKPILVALVLGAALCGAGVWMFAVRREAIDARRESDAGAEATSRAKDGVRALARRFERLEARVEDAVAKLGSLEALLERSLAGAAPSASTGESKLATAAPEAAGDAAGASVPAVAAGDGATDAEPVDLDESLAVLWDPSTSDSESTRTWSRLVKAGLLDQALAAFEKRAVESPQVADNHAELGDAYIQKLFQVGDLEKGIWSMKAHGAYDKALAIDDHHWEARFSKAVNYAFAPPIFGLQSKAITEFEVLRAQQEATGAPRAEFAQTYVLLGNLYENQGQAEKAREVWAKGASVLPDSADLRERAARGRDGASAQRGQ